MVRKKQVNNENRAVLNRDFPMRSRSLIDEYIVWVYAYF